MKRQSFHAVTRSLPAVPAQAAIPYGFDVDAADDAVDRFEQELLEHQDKLPSKYASSSLVIRPSPWRIVPLIVICLAFASIGLIPQALLLIRALALVPLALAIYLAIELCTHRVVIDATSVSDVRIRSTSVNDGSDESYPILEVSPLSWRMKLRPIAIVWTGTDGNDHRLSFAWFRRDDARTIIAGVDALR